MYKILCISLCILGFSSRQIKAQSYIPCTEQIIPLTIFSLDSRGSGFFSRQYNTVLEVDLPPGTIKWLYRFHSASTISQANRWVKEPTGWLSWIDQYVQDSAVAPLKKLSDEDAPPVNIYLLADSSSVNVFTSWISFSRNFFVPRYSILNETSGWVVVDDENFLKGKRDRKSVV